MITITSKLKVKRTYSWEFIQKSESLEKYVTGRNECGSVQIKDSTLLENKDCSECTAI